MAGKPHTYAIALKAKYSVSGAADQRTADK
jgi:hypothetical protein